MSGKSKCSHRSAGSSKKHGIVLAKSFLAAFVIHTYGGCLAGCLVGCNVLSYVGQ